MIPLDMFTLYLISFWVPHLLYCLMYNVVQKEACEVFLKRRSWGTFRTKQPKFWQLVYRMAPRNPIPLPPDPYHPTTPRPPPPGSLPPPGPPPPLGPPPPRTPDLHHPLTPTIPYHHWPPAPTTTTINWYFCVSIPETNFLERFSFRVRSWTQAAVLIQRMKHQIYSAQCTPRNQ